MLWNKLHERDGKLKLRVPVFLGLLVWIYRLVWLYLWGSLTTADHFMLIGLGELTVLGITSILIVVSDRASDPPRLVVDPAQRRIMPVMAVIIPIVWVLILVYSMESPFGGTVGYLLSLAMLMYHNKWYHWRQYRGEIILSVIAAFAAGLWGFWVIYPGVII